MTIGPLALVCVRGGARGAWTRARAGGCARHEHAAAATTTATQTHDQRLVDVRDDTAARDGGLDERVELLVAADGELQVARRDTLHLEVLGRIARELQHCARGQAGGKNSGKAGEASARAAGNARQACVRAEGDSAARRLAAARHAPSAVRYSRMAAA